MDATTRTAPGTLCTCGHTFGCHGSHGVNGCHAPDKADRRRMCDCREFTPMAPPTTPDPLDRVLAQLPTENHTRAVRRAIRALGVIMATPQIAGYLIRTDPQALNQVRGAYYSFTDAEIEEATSTTEAQIADAKAPGEKQ